MADATSLVGKLALVTGAGMGIGQGIALELARQGADVAVHYAGSEQGARETVAQIEAMGRRSWRSRAGWARSSSAGASPARRSRRSAGSTSWSTTPA